MRYVDIIKTYISEDADLAKVVPTMSQMRKDARDQVRSGKMSKKQRIARTYSDVSKRAGKDKTAKGLLALYKRIEGISEKKDWIQGAVKHPGRCTPMPNPDCPVGSPQYNLGKRFKKAASKKKAKGGTGWQGKV